MTSRLTSLLFRLLFPFLLLTVFARGQEPAPPVPPPDERNGPKHPPRVEEDDKHWKPRPDNGGDRMRGGGPRGEMNFGKLTKEERERVRIAMGKAWANAEVQTARAKLQSATQEYREALRLALEKEDPGISALMEKARPPEFPQEGMPPYAEGLVRELFHKLDESEKKDIPSVTQQVFKNPEVIKAVESIGTAKEEERVTFTRNLRKTLRKALAQIKPEWEKKLRDEEEK